MSSNRAKIYFYAIFAFIVVVAFLVPRGQTVLNTSISLAPDGKPVLGAVVDKTEAFSEKDSGITKLVKEKGSLYGQSFRKVDYGFIVYYDFFYRFDLSSVPDYVPDQFVFSVDMPGEMTGVRGGSFEKNKAFWVLQRGQAGDFQASSKVTRWWLVVLSGFAIIFMTYAIILLYRKSKTTEARGTWVQ